MHDTYYTANPDGHNNLTGALRLVEGREILLYF